MPTSSYMVRGVPEARDPGASDEGDRPRAPGPKFFEVWRAPEVDRALEDAARELAARVEQVGVESALDAALAAARRARVTTFASELSSFAWAAAGLALAPPGSEEASVLFRRGTHALLRVGVGTHGSRLSHLHTRLRRHVFAGADAPDEVDLSLRVLERALPGDALSRESMALAEARVLRASGELDRAERVLSALRRDDLDLVEVRWELALVDATRTGTLDAPSRVLREVRAVRTAYRARLYHLWAHATFSKAWMKQAGSVSALRRASRGEEGPSVVAELRVAACLERAYAARVPLGARLEGVRRALDDAEEIEDACAQALAVAALARWLSRAKQSELGARVAERYEAHSLSLTRGRERDLFHLDLAARTSDRDAAEDGASSPSRGVATGLRRELEVAKLGASLLGAVGASALSGASGDDRLVTYARILAEQSAALRGPLMKLGQVLSFYGAPLPDEALETLSGLVDGAETLPFDDVRAIVEREHEAPLERTFARFDEEPLAAGSVGQIHAAELTGGARVIVKVRYPGIEDAIRRDFRSLALLRPILAAALPTIDWSATLSELRGLALGECDFAKEGAHQARFRRRLHDEPGVHVPRIEPSLTTASVLVAERFDGASFATFRRMATERERRRAAEILVRYVVRTTAIEREFNTDMHPGNLLFDGERVCFVDFGSVRAWPEAESDGWRRILEGVMADDAAAVREGLLRVRVAEAASDIDFARVHQLLRGHLLRVVAEGGPQRISKETLLREVALMGPNAPPGTRGLRIPPEYAYGFRMYWGMFAVLADLGASVDYRAVCASVLARFPRAAHGGGA